MAQRPRFLKARNYLRKAVGVCSSFFGVAAIKALTFIIDKSRIWRYELTYRLHLRVRKFHDVLVVKSPVYKKTTESKYAVPVKNATISAFFVSLMLFTTIQFILPYLNPFKSGLVQAGANSVTWSTNGDFTYNKSALCGATTQSQIAISGTAYTDASCTAAAADASLELNSSSTPQGALAVSGGADFALALMADGTVRSWGKNNVGQLGNGTNTESNVPVTVSGITGTTAGTRAIAVSAGSDWVGGGHALALMADGTIKSWGRNGYGELGNGATGGSSNIPVTVIGITGANAVTRAIAISAGINYSTAVMADGTIKSWGFNSTAGTLGNNSTTDSNAPVSVSNINGTTAATRATAISAGNGHTAALMADGTIKTWGAGTIGQLGNNGTSNSLVPVNVSNINGSTAALRAMAVATGNTQTLALMADGTVKSWGYNMAGELGNGSASGTQANVPVNVSVITGASAALRATAISAGARVSMALMADGTVKTWGYNGTLGNNTNDASTIPVTVTGIDGLTAVNRATYVSEGMNNGASYVLMADGKIKSWGTGTNGRLGNGSSSTQLVPVTVSGIAGAVASSRAISVSTGTFNGAAVMADGSARVWGGNTWGQLGNNSQGGASNIPVVVSNLDGSSADKRAVSISLGHYNAYALMADGTVKAWGQPGFLGNGSVYSGSVVQTVPTNVSGIDGTTPAKRAVSVSSSSSTVIALMADGTVKTWGSNNYGQLGNGNTGTDALAPVDVQGINGSSAATRAVGISSGSSNMYALMSDGTIKSWGYNLNGELGNGNTGTDSNLPVSVSIIDGLSAANRAVSMGRGTGEVRNALMADGTVSSWGKSAYSGGFGDGTYGVSNTPVKATGIDGATPANRATAVISGGYFGAGIMADGSVKFWGYNQEVPFSASTPVLVPGFSGTSSFNQSTVISSIGNTFIALEANGSIKSWGDNTNGRLGNGNTGTDSSVPVSVLNIAGGMVVALYTSPGTISGLKVDAGVGQKYKWNSVNWNTAALPANTSVTFKYRTSEDGSTWSDTTWAGAGTTQSSGSTGTADLSVLNATRYLEIQLTLTTSDGVSSPTLNDFTVTYDSLEAPANGNITMYKADGTTQLKNSSGTAVAAGVGAGWTNEQSLVIKATGLTCGSTGGTNRCGGVSNGRKPEAEIKPVGTPFATNPVSGTDTIVGTSDNSGVDQELESGYVTIPASKLTTIGSPGYHFRVRTTDEAGRVSGWTNYASDGLAFTIEQTTPTGTISIGGANVTGNYAKSTSVTLDTSSAADTGGSGLAEMQFSNNGITWSGWEAYSPTKAWTLSSGDGPKTVYAQCRDWAGNISGDTWSTKAEFSSGSLGPNLTVSGASPADYSTVSLKYELDNTVSMISGAFNNTTALRSDGTALAVGNNAYGQLTSIATWNNLKSVSAGENTHILGLKNDGTVYGAGNNSLGQVNVGSWSNIRSVGTGYASSFGITNNGTVIAIGYDAYGQLNVSGWSDIKQVSGYNHTLGLKNDGTVLCIGDNGNGQCNNVGSWSDTKKVLAGASHSVGLKNDGTLVGVGDNNNGQLNFGTWTGVKDIAVTGRGTLGLKEDGTVLAVGDNTYGPLDVGTWSNITSIECGYYHCVGLRGDGTLVATGRDYGQLAVGSFTDVKQPPLIFNSPGVLSGLVYDSGPGKTQKWMASRWQTSSLPANSRVKLRARTSDNGSSWSGYSSYITQSSAGTTSGGGAFSGLADSRYLSIELTLESDDGLGSPILSDLVLESALFSSVTLDTTPPANVTGLAGYVSDGGAALSQASWYDNKTPYFDWDDSADGDLNHYEYCLGASNCTPNLTRNTISNVALDLNNATNYPDGTYYMRVVAHDNAGQPSTTPDSWTYNFDRTTPVAVTGYSATQIHDAYIGIDWTPVSVQNGSPVTYTIERIRNTKFQEGFTVNDFAGHIWSQQTAHGYAEFTGVTGNSYQDNIALKDRGIKYAYRIKAVDETAKESPYQNDAFFGLTRDGITPTSPSNVVVAPCSYQSQAACSDFGSPTPDDSLKGHEVKVSWTRATDDGTGVQKYYVIRVDNIFDGSYVAEDIAATLVVDPENPVQAMVVYVATGISDYTIYHFRVVAEDGSTPPNKSPYLPSSDENYNFARTPDVTPPSAPVVSATPGGMDDPMANEPKQKIIISWSQSVDAGSGVNTYVLYRADRPGELTDQSGSLTDNEFIDITSSPNVTCNLTLRECTEVGLEDVSHYYYRVRAKDNVADPYTNISPFSNNAYTKTLSSAVPSPPRGRKIPDSSPLAYEPFPYVYSIKGDPTTVGSRVGKDIQIQFTGSRLKDDQPYLVLYEVYRSTDNLAWSKVGGDINPIRNENDTDNTYTVTDTGVADATKYYYRVKAIGNNPNVTGGGESYSGVGSNVNQGWDITPDVTAPALPTGLKVKDIHDDGTNYKRNIITWERIAEPKRNGDNDFREYRIYRSNDGLVWGQICKAAVDSVNTVYLPGGCDDTRPNPLYDINKEIGLATNYYMDLIPIGDADQDYYYYVAAVDDAKDAYRYVNNNVINGYSNESAPNRTPDNKIVAVNINPAIAQPTITRTGDNAPKVVNVGVSTATVEWYADQLTDSVVEFRAQGTSKWVTIGDRVPKYYNEKHTVSLFGLLPTTTYEYKLISRNSLGNEDVVGDADNEKQYLPILTTSGFSISNIDYTSTTTSATVTWNTNIWANGNYVEYQMQGVTNGSGSGNGPAGQNMSPVLDSNQVLRQNLTPAEIQEYLLGHKVYIGGLKSSQTYSFKLKSISVDGYVTYSDLGTFTTRSFDTAQFSLAPTSSNVADRNITSTTAQIVWQTAVPTTSWIEYGTTSGSYGTSAGDNTLTMVHVVTLEGLTPGTKYYYRARVKDLNDVEYTSPEYSFTAILKPKISNMTVKNITPYSVTIAWETNVDTETIVNWGTTTAYGEKRGKNGVSKVHELVIDNLLDNQEYHYQILAKDEAGNEVADTDKLVRTPLDTEGPKITNAKTDILPMGENDTTASVIISWNTNKPASTLVEYDEGIIGGNYANRSVEDTSLNTSHTVIVKNLKPASSFHYRMVSADKRNNITQSQDYTFVTPTKEKSILQLILKSLEDTFAWTKNLNQFFGNVGKRITGQK